MAVIGLYIENAILPCCPGAIYPPEPVEPKEYILVTEDEEPITTEGEEEINVENEN